MLILLPFNHEHLLAHHTRFHRYAKEAVSNAPLESKTIDLLQLQVLPKGPIRL